MKINYKINDIIIDNINELIFQYQQFVDFVLRNKCEINMESIRKMANDIIEIKKDIKQEEFNMKILETMDFHQKENKNDELLGYYRKFMDVLFNEDDSRSNIKQMSRLTEKINELEKTLE